jgi:hypothetical protein
LAGGKVNDDDDNDNDDYDENNNNNCLSDVQHNTIFYFCDFCMNHNLCDGYMDGVPVSLQQTACEQSIGT